MVTAPPPNQQDLDLVGSVADRLRVLPAASLDASLWRGAAGLALAFAELAALSGDGRDLDAAERYLAIAIDRATEDRTVGLALFGGLAGVGWVETAVERIGGVEPQAGSDLDCLLGDLLDGGEWRGPWDLVAGLVGLGVYALARPAPDGPLLLGRVVRRLEPLAERGWSMPSPRGGPNSVDLGVAHGLAGVVGFLAAAASIDPNAVGLLASATAGLLRHELPGETGPRFPGIVVAARPPGPGPTAWCYGDPGVAAALVAAAARLSDPTVDAAAVRVSRSAAAAAAAPVRHAGICHGAAGLAIALAALADTTGDHAAAVAAAGWRSRLRRTTLDPTLLDLGVLDVGFLEGAAGILLALLGSNATGWQDLLLLPRHVPGVRPIESVGLTTRP